MTAEPSTICKDAEGRKMWIMTSPPDEATEMKRRRPGGHVLVRQPRGEDEKIARSWDHPFREVLDNEIVMFQVHQKGASLSY